MNKKFLSILMSLLLSATNLVGYAAEADQNIEIVLQIGNPIMTVNNTQKEIDPGMGTAPVVINDRTLLPVRAVVEEMGGAVGWNGDTQEVTLSYNND
ncbi:MAG: copper amine oxidase N-terminal domain-containing protein, partial [Candidatus Gastranaerophilaceae bacterium]